MLSIRASVLLSLLFSLIGANSAATVLGQGFLIPSDPKVAYWHPRPGIPITPPIRTPPPRTYEVEKIAVDASIQDQVATVTVAQTFRNTSSQTLQVRFVFPMPYDGAVDQMTFLVDGNELPGELMDADEARKKFADYVRRREDPALVQWLGTGMFQTQVFPVPAGAERTVSLRYIQLLRRTGSMTEWLLPLDPARTGGTPVKKLEVHARIRGAAPLTNVYSPTHDLKIDKQNRRTVSIKINESKPASSGNLRILWDQTEAPVPMSLVGYQGSSKEDGYFMLLLQPDLPEPTTEDRQQGKRIVLVLDKSGSMKQEKIKQARAAVSYVLSQLKPRDQFELIAYDNTVESYARTLTPAKKKTVQDATEYVESLLAGGGTNINDALQAALQVTEKESKPAYIVFLTDGRPTAGVTKIGQIVANATAANTQRARLLSLGVGHDVNSRLLDKLSDEMLGQTIYVSPGEAIDDHVRKLYDRIGAPALTDVDIRLSVDGKPGAIRQLFPHDMVDLFSGDQVVIVGRYRRAGELKIELTGNLGDEKQTYKFQGILPNAKESKGSHAFVERLWAIRRIGSIIDEIDLHGEQAELIDELIALSKRHGVLTPYTAFLADEEVGLNDRQAQTGAARSSLGRLHLESGAEAFHQRSAKSQLKSASRYNQAAQAYSVVENGPASGSASPASNQMNQAGRPALTPIRSANGFGAGGMRQPTLHPATPSKPRASTPPVRLLGERTFYQRGEMLVDAMATDKQLAQPQTIKQFGDGYFDLLEKLTSEQKIWLAQNQPLIVVINDVAYKIVPAEAASE